MDIADCLSPGHLVIIVWPRVSSILVLQERNNNTIPKRAILFFIISSVDVYFALFNVFTFFMEANVWCIVSCEVEQLTLQVHIKLKIRKDFQKYARTSNRLWPLLCFRYFFNSNSLSIISIIFFRWFSNLGY